MVYEHGVALEQSPPESKNGQQENPYKVLYLLYHVIVQTILYQTVLYYSLLYSTLLCSTKYYGDFQESWAPNMDPKE